MKQRSQDYMFAFGKVFNVFLFGVAASGLLGHALHQSHWYTWGGDGKLSIPAATGFLLTSITIFILYWQRIEKEVPTSRKKKKLARA